MSVLLSFSGFVQITIIIMVPAHFHDVEGDLSDHNVRKIFELSKILLRCQNMFYDLNTSFT